MQQPTRRKKRPAVKGDKVKKTALRGKRPHPKYGTSKLEERFAKEFLDKMGFTYERQYEAKDIGRFYDFAIKQIDGSVVLIEIDGDYFHGRGLIHEEKNPMQKRNERVDKIKDEWAAERGIPLIRIWEHDINNNPEKVRKTLVERLESARMKAERIKEKKKRH